MRWIIVIPILMLSVLTNAATITPNERVTSHVVIRSEPGGAKVGRLEPGKSLPYIESVTNYYVVKLESGKKGYLSKGYTSLVETDAEFTSNKELDIHFIDVGQGDSTLIKCPNGKNILIDAGSLSGANPETVREYLLEQLDRREQKIHTLIVTHPDGDHYNLLSSVLNDIPVEQAFWTGAEKDYTNTGFQNWFFKGSVKRFHLIETDYDSEQHPNTKINCGSASTYILAAGVVPSSIKDKKNASSIVLMIRYGDFEAIFTGDATRDTERKILERYSPAWLDIDLLKIGHHGSNSTSTSVSWVEVLSPELAVASAGDQNGFGHPREEVIKRLEPYTVESELHAIETGSGKKGNYTYTYKDNYKEAIFSTVTSGAIEVKTTGNGWLVSQEASD
jgi:competence protein ComEC